MSVDTYITISSTKLPQGDGTTRMYNKIYIFHQGGNYHGITTLVAVVSLVTKLLLQEDRFLHQVK